MQTHSWIEKQNRRSSSQHLICVDPDQGRRKGGVKGLLPPPLEHLESIGGGGNIVTEQAVEAATAWLVLLNEMDVLTRDKGVQGLCL